MGRIKIFYVIIFISFIGTVVAETKAPNVLVHKFSQEIHQELQGLGSLKPKDFQTKIDSVRGQLDRFFGLKKRVCNGEFSTVVLTEGVTDNSQSSSDKLSKEERKLCFRELKALQMTYIDKLFEARKNYLGFLHTKRLKDLDDAKKEAVFNLQKTFSRSGWRRNR